MMLFILLIVSRITCGGFWQIPYKDDACTEGKSFLTLFIEEGSCYPTTSGGFENFKRTSSNQITNNLECDSSCTTCKRNTTFPEATCLTKYTGLWAEMFYQDEPKKPSDQAYFVGYYYNDQTCGDANRVYTYIQTPFCQEGSVSSTKVYCENGVLKVAMWQNPNCNAMTMSVMNYPAACSADLFKYYHKLSCTY